MPILRKLYQRFPTELPWKPTCRNRLIRRYFSRIREDPYLIVRRYKSLRIFNWLPKCLSLLALSHLWRNLINTLWEQARTLWSHFHIVAHHTYPYWENSIYFPQLQIWREAWGVYLSYQDFLSHSLERNHAHKFRSYLTIWENRLTPLPFKSNKNWCNVN